MRILTQITEDGTPISLSDIVEVVNCPKDQAESLLQLLLKEYPQIGNYVVENKIYTKSKGYEVSVYLKNALKLIEDLEEED